MTQKTEEAMSDDECERVIATLLATYNPGTAALELLDGFPPCRRLGILQMMQGTSDAMTARRH